MWGTAPCIFVLSYFSLLFCEEDCFTFYTCFLFAEKLTQILEDEREAPREFQPLPFHYVEISRLLFDQ